MICNHVGHAPYNCPNIHPQTNPRPPGPTLSDEECDRLATKAWADVGMWRPPSVEVYRSMIRAAWAELRREAHRHLAGVHLHIEPADAPETQCQACDNEELAHDAIDAFADRSEAAERERDAAVNDGLVIAAALVKERDDWKRAMLNLAAVLHHDGGHWMTREMTPQEVLDDCIRVWSEDVKAADARAYAIERERDEARRIAKDLVRGEGGSLKANCPWLR